MKSAVIVASCTFFLALFNATIGLLNGDVSVDDAIWLTGSLFWLRFEACLAIRNLEKQQ